MLDSCYKLWVLIAYDYMINSLKDFSEQFQKKNITPEQAQDVEKIEGTKGFFRRAMDAVSSFGKRTVEQSEIVNGVKKVGRMFERKPKEVRREFSPVRMEPAEDFHAPWLYDDQVPAPYEKAVEEVVSTKKEEIPATTQVATEIEVENNQNLEETGVLQFRQEKVAQATTPSKPAGVFLRTKKVGNESTTADITVGEFEKLRDSFSPQELLADISNGISSTDMIEKYIPESADLRKQTLKHVQTLENFGEFDGRTSDLWNLIGNIAEQKEMRGWAFNENFAAVISEHKQPLEITEIKKAA